MHHDFLVKKPFVLVGLALCCVMWMSPSVSPASAEKQSTTSFEKNSQESEDEWEFSVVPYLWFISVSGDATIKGASASVDASFRDVWDELNLGIMALVQARWKRFGAYADVIYAHLQAENGISRGGSVSSDFTSVITDVVGFYRLGPFRLGNRSNGAAPNVIVDPYVGFRSWSLRTRFNIRTRVLPTLSARSDQVWFDLITGARTNWNFTDRWNMKLQADIGGGSSDLTTQGILTFGYRFDMWGDKNANVQLGYRVMYTDYATGQGRDRFALRATIYGPILGLGVRF